MTEGRKFTIGRDPRCDIAVADDSVSRVHAEFLCAADGSMTVRDRGSRNGTRVLRKGAAKPVAEVEEVVYLTDTLQFGGASLTVGVLYFHGLGAVTCAAIQSQATRAGIGTF